MRRAWWPVLALGFALASRTAHAGPWTLTLEGGAEADTNVERVETDATGSVAPISALAVRTGARVEHTASSLGGTLALSAGASARGLVTARDQTTAEDVGLVAGDLRYVHPLGERPVWLGAALQAADAFALDADVGDRTFRNLGADALLVLRPDESHRLTLALGGRQFQYKPAREFDYLAPSASVRLDLGLWTSADTTRTVELAATVGFEPRAFDSAALVDACPPGRVDATCTATSSFLRRDRYHRGDLQLTYVGTRVVALQYQLVVVASNSFGQSLVRHRVTLSATTPLPGRLFLTGIATLQLDQYPDGLLIATDVAHTEFSNLEDENRSSAQVRIGRPITDAWSVEARAAIWRNLGSANAATPTDFHRELVYAGLVYTR